MVTRFLRIRRGPRIVSKFGVVKTQADTTHPLSHGIPE